MLDAHQAIFSIGTWLDAHNGAVIAIFTIALVVSTTGLWWTTNKTLNASIAADAPRIRLSGLSLTSTSGDIHDVSSMPMVTAKFKNYGARGAALWQANLEVVCAGSLPKRPTYTRFSYLKMGEIVEPGGEFELQPFPIFDAAKWRNHDHPEFVFKNWLYVYGRIRYFDHLNRECVHGFVANWIPPQVHGPQPGSERFIWIKKSIGAMTDNSLARISTSSRPGERRRDLLARESKRWCLRIFRKLTT